MRDITKLFGNYRLFQEKNGFRFSIDAVILSLFFPERKNKKILEIGTGNGIIPIILLGKNKIDTITCVEIQEKVSQLAIENIKLNGFEKNVRVENCDIKNFKEGNSYDVIISNPPYMKVDGKKINLEESKSIARHEVCLTLEEFIISAKRLLKPRGEIYIVHQTSRLQDILLLFEKNNFFPEKIQFAYHKKNTKSNLVLIKALKGKKTILEVEEPLYMDELNFELEE